MGESARRRSKQALGSKASAEQSTLDRRADEVVAAEHDTGVYRRGGDDRQNGRHRQGVGNGVTCQDVPALNSIAKPPPKMRAGLLLQPLHGFVRVWRDTDDIGADEVSARRHIR